MPGLSKYDDKSKRRERRHNHVARDLLTPKYAQRIVPERKSSYADEETRYNWTETDSDN